MRTLAGCHDGVIYESLSSVRSVVSRLDAGDARRLVRVAHCPTLFRARVPGTDYRPHVVGERVIATMLASDADDYRYDRHAERIAVEYVEPPGRPVIAEALAALLAAPGR